MIEAEKWLMSGGMVMELKCGLSGILQTVSTFKSIACI